MIDLMNVREQVDPDYVRARRRALIGRLVSWARRRCAGLWAFDEARRALGAENRRHLGRKTVEGGRVVGSVGRWRELDAGFMPTRASAERWKRVDLAFRRGEELPPVSLYKIGAYYFVRDGNHRVSVARFLGAEMIDAEVIEFFPSQRNDRETAA